ncbi:hypothetical protein [Gordonia neofelifaecis]|uniref:EthD domain-containing protein n=1 Tax=Gordonia neofelifaecis NRRL B-59395 TaxID=644548 RepID=F1YPH1_9ACTN|nr:hypothetical protein [Gordonia neofelifaecis]EGD53422.1 hypothetical protein SCNU_19130 [Gordonia neofelifaecis NRRL B-59395]
MSTPVYLVDRVVTAPGAGEEFVRRYRDEYLPAAADRGITATTIVVSPPLWLDHESNTVTAILAVDSVSGWWTAALAGRHDPAPAAWWASVEHLVVERSRVSAAAADDLAVLADV